MPAYHQMGHDSENLVFEKGLDAFSGIILSPVNRNQTEIQRHVATVREQRPSLDVIFDPQLYIPQSQRDVLRTWPYFPAELDSHDASDLGWWKRNVDSIITCAKTFSPDAICSPKPLARATFSNEYYSLALEVGDYLTSSLKGMSTRPIQTVLVRLPDLSDINRAFELASLLSKSKCQDMFLLLTSDIEPRRELQPGDDVRGVMILIRLLERAGFRILVGMSAADMVLWKAAGAWGCATGKFFNLRRFTRSRWDEPRSGGGTVAYWFEEALLAFVREGDLIRLRDEGLLSQASLNNPFGQAILARFQPETQRTPWLGDSWRHFMYWFADAEQRITDGLDVDDLLKVADANWGEVDARGLIMEERHNDGAWVRLWRRALREYRKTVPA